MLAIYRRHQKHCEHRGEGRSYRRCRCMIWVDGSVGGVEVQKSLRTRDWQKAQDIVRQWEAEGERVEEAQPIIEKEGCDKFMADAEARGLREPTLYKYRLLFRQFQGFSATHGLSLMIHFDVDALR